MLLGPQAEVLYAGGLAVEAAWRRLHQRAVPHLLGLRQALVVGRAGQRAQRGRHVDVHAQVGQRGRRAHIEGRVVHHVAGGRHVLAKLLLQPQEAERRRRVGVALGQTAGHAAGGRHGGGAQGGV